MNDQTVGYMERTRRYYEAQGFKRPYQWATHDEVPFTRPAKPLARSRLTLVTTAALYDRNESDPRHVASERIEQTPERLFANDLSWDKKATHMDDRESFLPIRVLQNFVGEGRLGGLTEHFHCVPTEYSQRRTREADAPEVADRCLADGTDIALLIPI